MARTEFNWQELVFGITYEDLSYVVEKITGREYTVLSEAQYKELGRLVADSLGVEFEDGETDDIVRKFLKQQGDGSK